MKVKTWLDISGEYEVDVSMGEVLSQLTDRSDGVLSLLNQVAAALRQVTNEDVTSLNPKQREVVSKFLGDAAMRFTESEPADPPLPGHKATCKQYDGSTTAAECDCNPADPQPDKPEGGE